MSEQERLLIERCQSGDVGSFEQLIGTHQQYVYNIAFRMMGNEEDAKDAAQEALIKVFKNIGSYRHDSKFSTWLYRIVMNTCKDLLRKRKSNVISIDKGIATDEGEVQMEFEDPNASPVRDYERKEVQETIQEAMEDLPEANKSVLILREIKDYSYDEISDILDIPVGTVRSRINRGRKMLADRLRERLPDHIPNRNTQRKGGERA